MLIFCETIMLWDVIFYSDDGLTIDTFGDYFYEIPQLFKSF
jgi:hypothetical protein